MNQTEREAMGALVVNLQGIRQRMAGVHVDTVDSLQKLPQRARQGAAVTR